MTSLAPKRVDRPPPTVDAIPDRRRRAVRRAPWSAGRRPTLGLLACLFLLATALVGPALLPHAPDAVDLETVLQPPAWAEGGGWAHPLGTDQLGRDMLSRLVAGTRISLATALAAVVIAGSVGTLLGVVTGYIGGAVDAVFMRIVDAFLALPFILMALAFVSALGTGLGNIIMVMVLTNWARYARLVRSEVLALKQRDFVLLARVAGVGPAGIVGRHILPNALNSILILATVDVGRAVILESSLSFLGLGIQPPDTSWGLMLADGRTYMAFAWWLTVLPGLAIVLTVLSANAVGDWLKTILDPREAP